MEVWLLSVEYGNMHGVYSSKERALAAALHYIEESIEDEDLLEEVREGLYRSYNKNIDYFECEGFFGYVDAECWRVDEEFEEEDNEAN